MSRNIYWCTAVAVLLGNPLNALAASDTDLQSVTEQIQQLKQSNARAGTALAASGKHRCPSRPLAAAPPRAARTAFNPAVSLILSGTYEQLQARPRHPGDRFCDESQRHRLHARIFAAGIGAEHLCQYRSAVQRRGHHSHWLRRAASAWRTPSCRPARWATASISNSGGSSPASAISTSNTRMSGISSTSRWCTACCGTTSIADDGVQLKWLAPTDMFFEIGGELGRGLNYPGTDQNKNGAGAGVLFAHIGDDIGIEQSWRAGVSLQETRRVDAVSDNVPDVPGTPGGVSNSFTGDSRTAGLDFVWKYSPNGNIRERYLKVQSEYFRQQGKRHSDLRHRIPQQQAGRPPAATAVTQSGWYLQSVYQFMPNWRTGLRYDRLDPGYCQRGRVASRPMSSAITRSTRRDSPGWRTTTPANFRAYACNWRTTNRARD